MVWPGKARRSGFLPWPHQSPAAGWPPHPATYSHADGGGHLATGRRFLPEGRRTKVTKAMEGTLEF